MKSAVRTFFPLLAVWTLALPLAGCGPSKSELAGEIATLKEQLVQRQSEGKTFQQQAANSQSELEGARKALAESRSAVEAGNKALAETRSMLTAREGRISELEQAAAQLGQTSRDLEKTLEARSAEIAQAQVAARSAAAERDTLAAELATARSRLATLDRELQQSSGNLGQEQKRASELTDRLATALGEQSKLRQSTDAQRAEIAAISAALADAQAKVAGLTGARGIYTVQEGDSLSSIALYFYRNAHRWPGIAQANRHLINPPDKICPAMVLIIPK